MAIQYINAEFTDYSPANLTLINFNFGVEPGYTGNYFDFAQTLDEVSGNFTCQYTGITSATFSADLDSVIGAFNCTVRLPVQATFSETLEDAYGYFDTKSYINPSIVTTFSVTLSDVVPSFTTAYDPNILRKTISSTLTDSRTGELVSLYWTSLQDQSIRLSVLTESLQDSTIPLCSSWVSLLEEMATLDYLYRTSAQDTAVSLTTSFNSILEQSIPVSVDCYSFVDETVKGVSSGFWVKLEQMIPVNNWVTGVFESMLDNPFTFTFWMADVPPPQYRYTPTSVFDSGLSYSSYSLTAAKTWDTSEPNAVKHYDFTTPTILTLSSISFEYDAPVPNLGTWEIQVVVGNSYTPSTILQSDYIVQRTERIGFNQVSGLRFSLLGVSSVLSKHAKIFSATYEQAVQPVEGFHPAVGLERPLPRPPLPGIIKVTIPRKQAYNMLHNLSVKLLDNTDIGMKDISLSCDVDSWTWVFSGTLADITQVDLVTPAVDGSPVTLVIGINGTTWKVLVERVTKSRRFENTSISISGRGLSAELGQPYQVKASAAFGSVLTVQQIADLAMPVGWTLDWQAPVWNIPAGAYDYANKTPIEVLSEIVQNIGAAIVPHTADRTVKVIPRYPVYPWDFNLVVADALIPDSIISSVTFRPSVPSQINAVYVHGGEVGGVMARCVLQGTAGDRLATTVTNNLMTDVIGCRSLGSRVLSAHATQPSVQSVDLYMDGDTVPLLSIGSLAQFNIGAAVVRGVINGVSIKASLGSVVQTVQIGEETPNVWSLFKELLPADPLLVGTVQSTSGNTSIVTLYDGGVLRVRGVGTVGVKYYIRAGSLDTIAPNLPLFELTV